MDELFSAYREEVNQLQLSDAEKDAIVARLDEALAAEPSPSPASEMPPVAQNRRPPLREAIRRGALLKAAACLAALAVLACSSAAIYARGTFSAARAYIGDVFGAAPADTELVGAIGRPLGAAATSGGIKVTCEAILGDASNVAIVYTLESTDGRSLEDLAEAGADGHYGLAFSGSSGFVVDGVSASGGAAYFYDAGPSDGKIQYVQLQHLDLAQGESLVGRTARVELRDLRLAGDGDDATVCSGSWGFKIKIDYEDASRTIGLNERIDFQGVELVVEQVSASPLAVTVAYSGGEDWVAARDVPVEVVYANGETLTGDSFSVTASGGEGPAHLEKTVFLDRLADVGDIAGVRIGGVFFPLGE